MLEGEIVDFRRGWECSNGETSHFHDGDARVKLGSWVAGRFERSECMHHPNHFGRVSDWWSTTLVHRVGLSEEG